MKHMAIICIIIICVVVLSGCTQQMSQEEIAIESAQNKMFMPVSRENYGVVIVDKETDVMYWMSNAAYNFGTLTLLVNPDGTPRIWRAK